MPRKRSARHRSFLWSLTKSFWCRSWDVGLGGLRRSWDVGLASLLGRGLVSRGKASLKRRVRWRCHARH